MLVDLHGGSIEAQSKEGDGSCFTIRLPIKPRSQIEELSPTQVTSASTEETPLVDCLAKDA